MTVRTVDIFVVVKSISYRVCRNAQFHILSSTGSLVIATRQLNTDFAWPPCCFTGYKMIATRRRLCTFRIWVTTYSDRILRSLALVLLPPQKFSRPATIVLIMVGHYEPQRTIRRYCYQIVWKCVRLKVTETGRFDSITLSNRRK